MKEGGHLMLTLYQLDFQIGFCSKLNLPVVCNYHLRGSPVGLFQAKSGALIVLCSARFERVVPPYQSCYVGNSRKGSRFDISARSDLSFPFELFVPVSILHQAHPCTDDIAFGVALHRSQEGEFQIRIYVTQWRVHPSDFEGRLKVVRIADWEEETQMCASNTSAV
jgi:hypothetical protein